MCVLRTRRSRATQVSKEVTRVRTSAPILVSTLARVYGIASSLWINENIASVIDNIILCVRVLGGRIFQPRDR